MAGDRIVFKIKRQDGPHARSYWQEFTVERTGNVGQNVISCLQAIQKNPRTASGQPTTAVVWDCNCLEEVCGACTMVINGRVGQACTARIKELSEPITLEPMSKFPVIRDLMVDRTAMFNNLLRIKAWLDIDGTHDLGAGPRQSHDDWGRTYPLSRCMTCGCCLEVCPNYPGDGFMGAALMAQVVRFNAHPTGKAHAQERLETVMGRGGITDCGNAQNCVEVCPKEIPLTDAIASLGGQTSWLAIKKLLGAA